MNRIKHYIKKLLRRTDFSGLSIFGRGQTFDWEILLTFFLVAVFVMVSFSVHVFLGVRAGDIFKENAKAAPKSSQTIDRDMMDQVIKKFDTRVENFKKIRSQRPSFVDPSL